MRGPLSKCESPDHFFKFIKPGLMSQLSIPISFRKYVKSKRHDETAILKRGCQKWSVKVINWAFSEGWDNFVRGNGVQEYDIIVFKHEGNMVFDIMVFDTSWCEREYSNNQVTESSRICKSDTNALKKISKEKDHPYFVSTLGCTDYKHRLYLPIDFTRSNSLSAGEMILRNGQSQRSWTVGLKTRRKRYTHIGPGWPDFLTANGLKEGDQFKLELIQSGIKPIANFYNLSCKPSESHGMVES